MCGLGGVKEDVSREKLPGYGQTLLRDSEIFEGCIDRSRWLCLRCRDQRGRIVLNVGVLRFFACGLLIFMGVFLKVDVRVWM